MEDASDKNLGTAFSSGEAVPFIKLHNAEVRRSGKTILSIDDFELAEGESIGILGPNGAGKSTFVGLITREIMPLYHDDPPVLFRGNPRATLMDIRKALGIVSSTMQNEISVHLPALDIVAGGYTGTLGLPHHIPEDVAAVAREEAVRPMKMLGIDDLAERDVMTLSTGQARRVLVARALIYDPDVLIVDEPCTGIDPEGMYNVRKNMRTLAQNGKAIILITHYPEDLIPEINRLVLLKDGTIFADGPKEELLTTDTMQELFGIPLRINCADGYYSLVTKY